MCGYSGSIRTLAFEVQHSEHLGATFRYPLSLHWDYTSDFVYDYTQLHLSSWDTFHYCCSCFLPDAWSVFWVYLVLTLWSTFIKLFLLSFSQGSYHSCSNSSYYFSYGWSTCWGILYPVGELRWGCSPDCSSSHVLDLPCTVTHMLIRSVKLSLNKITHTHKYFSDPSSTHDEPCASKNTETRSYLHWEDWHWHWIALEESVYKFHTIYISFCINELSPLLWRAMW